MKRHDFGEIFQLYPALIKAMPDRFTSHQFILRLARRHQKAYIEGLYAYRNGNDPFRLLHSQLSKLLTKLPNLVRQGKRVYGPDIFRVPSLSTAWSKVGR